MRWFLWMDISEKEKVTPGSAGTCRAVQSKPVCPVREIFFYLTGERTKRRYADAAHQTRARKIIAYRVREMTGITRSDQ